MSRIRVHASSNVPHARGGASKRNVSAAKYVPGSDEEQENEDDGYEEDSDGYSEHATPPRDPRQTRQSKLPFSPRKSRSQRIIAWDDSESERASAGPGPRVTRSRAVKITLGSAQSGDENEDDDTSEYAVTIQTANSSKTRKARYPPPSYGNIRPIDALGYDDYPSDTENATLRQHRGTCEKCLYAPSHDLLLTMKKSRKGKGKKRKRGSEDEFDYSDDEEKYRSLGGWVRWYVSLFPITSEALPMWPSQ